jgi:sec-independent protein translocase protein TatA
MPFNLGPGELLLILAIALVVLGPKKLPEAGRSLGRGLREFKNSVSNMSINDDEDEDKKPSLKARNGESASA